LMTAVWQPACGKSVRGWWGRRFRLLPLPPALPGGPRRSWSGLSRLVELPEPSDCEAQQRADCRDTEMPDHHVPGCLDDAMNLEHRYAGESGQQTGGRGSESWIENRALMQQPPEDNGNGNKEHHPAGQASPAGSPEICLVTKGQKTGE